MVKIEDFNIFSIKYLKNGENFYMYDESGNRIPEHVEVKFKDEKDLHYEVSLAIEGYYEIKKGLSLVKYYVYKLDGKKKIRIKLFYEGDLFVKLTKRDKKILRLLVKIIIKELGLKCIKFFASLRKVHKI